MRLFLILGLLFLKTTVYGQFTIGVKIGGIAFHQQPVSPNYYKWSIDKNGRFVGFAGFSITAGYHFNPFIGVKVIQTILSYDCAGKFSGITHIGVDFHDDIIGIKNERHQLSASFGPLFYYRKNWKSVPHYYVDEGFMNPSKNDQWERKFVWYAGQIQYDFYWNPREAISTNFLPGFPYIYTFITGYQISINE